MWNYEKRLQFPVKISTPCPKTASLIITQFGGPDGELAASMRYLSQRYSMPVSYTHLDVYKRQFHRTSPAWPDGGVSSIFPSSSLSLHFTHFTAFRSKL